MLRTVAIFLLAFFLVVALGLLVTQGPDLLIDRHSSGQWDFNQADFQVCVPVKPPPVVIRRGIPIEGSEKTSEVV